MNGCLRSLQALKFVVYKMHNNETERQNMFGKKYEQNFHVHDNANSFSTGHLISHDRATSALDKRGLMLHIREATVKRNGRMEIIASLVLKGNKISGQRFKFLTDTFPARRGETFVIDGTWGKNELPPL